MPTAACQLSRRFFDCKNFERLVHEGWQEFGGRIQQLRNK
jgi:hypothetical protein